jgi:uncharacterized protein (TIGR03067 family)
MLSLNARARVPNKQVQAPFDSAPDLRRWPKNMKTIPIIRSYFFAVAFIFLSEASWCADSENPLLGRWLIQRAGMHDATKLLMKIEWEFTDDKVIVRDFTNKEEVSRNSYKVDLTKAPKWITVTVVDIVTEVRPGIFRIVGDELHLKQEVEGGARPTVFPQNGYNIMKRQKIKEEGQQAAP